ncbi:MAG: hypothetical protein FWG52_08300 [Proteobacteria bacterium]|nr:hypothetical protein [Pseudomonadota bacterium]
MAGESKVLTNTTKDSVAQVKYKRKVRILLWGGASETGDNSAFLFAKNNVLREYRNMDSGKYDFIEKQIKVAKDIVETINAQEDDAIRPLDIWSHGGPAALYITTASPRPKGDVPWYKSWSYTAERWLIHNSSLYFSRARMIVNAAGWTSGSALVGDIKFAKFANNAKVELHGCRTAEEGDDNIASEFSRLLLEAGKVNSAVIGSAEKSNPNIKGAKTTNVEQDYRHGRRAIYKQGKRLRETKQKGAISEKELEDAK